MPSKRKPHEERTAEDYRNAAEGSLGLAKVLAGDGSMSDHDFLERMPSKTPVATTPTFVTIATNRVNTFEGAGVGDLLLGKE